MNLSISAAIPFYNNHSTLEKVIEGLEFQRPILSEIIVYDDGSNVSIIQFVVLKVPNCVNSKPIMEEGLSETKLQLIQILT